MTVWLDLRSSFELAAFFVTWAAVAALAVTALQLHLRLKRFEAGQAARPVKDGPPAPYSHLLGADVGGRLPAGVRLLLFVSAACPACARVLDELSARPLPAALAFTDASTPAGDLPPGTRLVEAGPALAGELGVRVTPFALVLDERGRAVEARPVTRLSSLTSLLASPSHDFAAHEAAA